MKKFYLFKLRVKHSKLINFSKDIDINFTPSESTSLLILYYNVFIN